MEELESLEACATGLGQNEILPIITTPLARYKQEISTILHRLYAEMGITVLLVEQKLHFTRAVADRFAIKDWGRVVVSESIEKLNERR